jgi:mRNA interferase MazF
MGAFAVGNVVLLPFPFSDLSGQKKRPALILAYSGSEYRDWVCLQITSQSYNDRDARQAPPFRAGKDSADGEAVQTQFIVQSRPCCDSKPSSTN